MTKEYTGSVYIGVVGGEVEIGECRDSIDAIRRRQGDVLRRNRGTKGFESRGMHYKLWHEETKQDFLCLLDHDMTFQPDTLERLRNHKLPYVSGYYLRRDYAPISPVWYEYGPKHKWPMVPWTKEPERGKLHKLGASGWGCVLLHRDVADAVKPLLKGEAPIIEDDMDVWPYDLERAMSAIYGLGELVNEKPPARMLRAALEQYEAALREEIRPLRGIKTNVGSDLRYPFFAREAGFVLMGDPDVRPGHMVNYPLNPDDYSGQTDEFRKSLKKEWEKEVKKERDLINEHLNNLERAGR